MCLVLVVLAAFAGGCGDDAPPPAETAEARSGSGSAPSAQPAEPSLPARPSTPNDERSIAGGLSWSATEPLRARAPGSRMRAAEYGVTGSEDAALTVFFFGPGQGGSVEENIDRWVGQLAQPDGRNPREAAEIERQEVNGIPVTRIELEGTFSGGMGPMGGGAPREGWKMLGAIAEGPQAPVFFKLVGPAADVDRAEAAFDALVNSIDRFR
jgi:hypothetical protein